MNLPTPVITRAKVQKFEELMRGGIDVRSELKLFHHFASGIYMRELHIPAGVITTGKIHKYPCLNILAKGRRQTLIDGRIEDVLAPHIHVSPAGIKRVSYTIEDSIWITVHPTEETDIAKLEADLVCETEEEYQAFCALEAERLKCLS